MAGSGGTSRQEGLAIVPNPGAGQASIRFSLPQTGPASLDILDATGRRVKRLHGGTLAAGPWAFDWNGRNESGRPVASGVYFARLQAGAVARTARVVLTR